LTYAGCFHQETILHVCPEKINHSPYFSIYSHDNSTFFKNIYMLWKRMEFSIPLYIYVLCCICSLPTQIECLKYQLQLFFLGRIHTDSRRRQIEKHLRRDTLQRIYFEQWTNIVWEIFILKVINKNYFHCLPFNKVILFLSPKIVIITYGTRKTLLIINYATLLSTKQFILWIFLTSHSHGYKDIIITWT
jgi:hypothetical protein